MSDLKIRDLIAEGEVQKLLELDGTIDRVKSTYVSAAKELAKGLKINVEGVADLEKLNAIYNTQAKVANSASAELSDALRKQAEISQTVTKRIEEKLNAEKLSSTEIRKLTQASEDNAASLERTAKAEAIVTKAQNEGNTTRKKATLTEEERLKLIRSAIALTNQEVHSRSQAKEMNKELQKAVDVLKDTDENYIRTLARLNSTIGVNTDYIKQNSDRYSQQKMTIGAYREEIKAAFSEISRGNISLKSMGDLAQSTGGYLRSSMGAGLNEVKVGVGSIIKGMVGAQAIIGSFQQLIGLFKSGIQSVIDFEAANSKLAAILGTTSNNMKDLVADAKRLGAATKYTASEATNLQIELAKLGFSKTEILQSTEGILKFAQATGAELPEAAALAGASLRMFNADTSETERYVSAMAVATSKSALSFRYLETAMPIVGPVAKAFNFQIEDTLALLGKLADAGFDASMSATATRNILLNLADGSGKLAKALGGPVKTLPELVAGLQKLKEQGVDLNTTLELTDKRSVAAFNAFLTAADKIVPLREQITGVKEDLTKMANTMEDNVEGALASLSSAWEAFMLSFSTSTGPAKDFLNWMAKKIRDIANELKSPEERITELGLNSKTLAAKTEETETIKIRMQFNKRKKELMEQGYSEEKANLKSLKEISEQRVEVSEDEKNRLEQMEKHASGTAKEYSKAKAKTWGDLLIPILPGGAKVIGATLESKDMNKLEQDALNAQKAYVDFAYTISKVDVKNAVIDKFLDSNKIEDPKKKTKELTDKEKKELEKAAKEKQKLEEQIKESELFLMDEGLKKELEKISLGYDKKKAAIKGGGKEEIAAREELEKEKKRALDDYTVKYNADREKKDIENALSVVKAGSKEELDLKLRQLDLQREAEIDAAEKTGEDVFLIDEKYARRKQVLHEKYASEQVKMIADNAAYEQILRDKQYQEDMSAAAERYANDLKSGKDSVEAKRKYEEEKYQITLDYTRKTTEAAIDALELQLKTAKLSAEEQAKIEAEIQKLRISLINKETDARITAIEKQEEAEDKAQKKRLNNLKRWLQVASQAIGAIGDLVSTVYDGQIEKIEEEQDLNDEKYDKDVERIENLAESGVITEEEAEARKRAAKALTEAKNEELEKKKQELAHKQAVWEKATGVAQAGIATALAIMNALQTKPFPVGMALAAVAGAMGAVQVATILATPIPSYAEGTKDAAGHRGGAALVGDAGKREVVMYNGLAWITPDTPTLMDIPKGAQVFPDVDELDMADLDLFNLGTPTFSPSNVSAAKSNTIVVNDYSRLEKRIDITNSLLLRSIKQQREDANNREFENYKNRRMG